MILEILGNREMTAKEISEEPNGNYRAELIIAKFRNGQPGSVFLGWDGSRTSFVNLESDANEQSIVAQFEKNEDAKRARKGNTAEDFNAAISKIVNETSVDDISGLEPPPEMPNDMPVMDFSDVMIPSDDELF